MVVGLADGDMDPSEFAKLYMSVFPGATMDQIEQNRVSALFQEVDVSKDGSVDLTELLCYLAKPCHQAYERPTTCREWMWLVLSPFDKAGAYDPMLEPASNRTVLWIKMIYNVLAQAFLIIYLIVILIESEPNMQNDRDGVDEGDNTTFALKTASHVFFTFELLLYIAVHPRGPLAWQQTNERRSRRRAQGKEPDAMSTPAAGAVVSKDKTIIEPDELYTDTIFWVNLITIIPYYVELGVGVAGLRAVTSLRFVWFMRMLRAGRALTVLLAPRGRLARIPKLLTALKRSSINIYWFIHLFFVLLCVCSTCVTYAERDQAHFNMTSQKWIRDENSDYIDAGEEIHFQSIATAMWWTIVTVTTVGYGDLYPTTIGGKVVGTFTILSGLIVISFPITILGSVFAQLTAEQNEANEMQNLRTRFYDGMLEWFQNGGEVTKKNVRKNPEIIELNNSMQQVLNKQDQMLSVLIGLNERISNLEAAQSAGR